MRTVQKALPLSCIYENTVAGSFVPQDQPFHSGGSDRWGDRAGSCEKYGAFAGASGAESEGDAAEDVEYESKNGIRSDLCIQAKAKNG